jgi:hypothetical protein
MSGRRFDGAKQAPEPVVDLKQLLLERRGSGRCRDCCVECEEFAHVGDGVCPSGDERVVAIF